MKASPFDALIFDLDGTLWDSTAPVVRAWNDTVKVLQVSDKPVEVNDIAGIMGMPHQQVFEKLLPNCNEMEREHFAKEFYPNEVRRLCTEGGELYPGVKEGITKLCANFSLFIVSNCQSNYLEIFFRLTGLRECFKGSECHGNTGKSKGENISLMVERFQLKSSAYIGDTASDQEAARRAGVHYFHVEYGFGTPSRECLSFRTFENLVSFFLSS